MKFRLAYRHNNKHIKISGKVKNIGAIRNKSVSDDDTDVCEQDFLIKNIF